MSQENVELVRGVLEPMDGVNLAEVDWTADVVREALGRTYSPDIELSTLNITITLDIANHYTGVDGLVEYLGKWLEPFSEYYVENLEYIDAGDCVLVRTRQRGIGEGSGARVDLELTNLYELRDGKVVRWHQHETLEAARAGAEGAST